MKKLVELVPGQWAHASGALWLEQERTALLADVHLGYGWALRRRGQMGPVCDGGARDRLHAMVDELQPERLVLLGDVVHAPRPNVPERFAIEETLLSLQSKAELTIVPGNHDRAFAQDFAHLKFPILPCWETEQLVAVHGDGALPLTEKIMVVGHHHPAFGVRDHAGVSHKLPVFLASTGVIVLPAFSPFAAGVDVARGMPPALSKLLGRGPVHGVAITPNRAVAIGRIR